MNLLKEEKEYDQALADASKILEIDPSFMSPKFRSSTIPELEKLQKEKFEKMKDEVMGNLKGIANKGLNYFGMSIDNFKSV